MSHPKKIPEIKPKMHLVMVVRINHVFRHNPAAMPIIPHAYICHGVQGPCPKKRLETNAVSAPTTNPLSAPNAIPVTIITKVDGCTLGIEANGTLLTAATAARTASITSSLPDMLRRSKRII